jgi:biopolymer transport protein ExbD
MITRPLDLVSRLSPPPRDLNAVAWINVGAIVLFFSLLGSRFVLAPGVLIGVGDSGVVELPAVDPASLNNVATSVVVSYRRDNVILFEGGRYTLAELKTPMEAYAKHNPGAVMLVQADRQVSTQALADLGAMARSVGFANIIVLAARAAGPEDASK